MCIIASVMEATPNRLQELRTDKGWSRETLARKVDVTLMTIYRIERGENEPGLRVAQRIAAVFDRAIEDVFPEPRSVA